MRLGLRPVAAVVVAVALASGHSSGSSARGLASVIVEEDGQPVDDQGRPIEPRQQPLQRIWLGEGDVAGGHDLETVPDRDDSPPRSRADGAARDRAAAEDDAEGHRGGSHEQTSRKHHGKHEGPRTSTTTATTTTNTETTTTRTRTSTTTTTRTTSTSTVTTTTTSTSTSTTGPHVFGGKITANAFMGWLSIWRSKYEVGVWNAGLTNPWESMLPDALKDIDTKVVVSYGGVASGIVTEGMGYGLMVEGFLAARGNETALNNSLSLAKSWLTMVNGPGTSEQPLAGGGNSSKSATNVDEWPYGVSAIEWSHAKMAPAGLAAWKFPINESNIEERIGSAADGDQDAILGMVYIAEALGYPTDFVDVVIRSIIAFVSADLGFPDLYRVLPDGTKIFVPKLGSMWGGLTPPHGKWKTKQQAWCFSPGYFAPAHYRTFRNFLQRHWREEFNDYLPPRLNGDETSLLEVIAAFDSAVTAGYNILYYSSCSSGSVSNWVGVKAPCESDDDLHCAGVPWEFTPYVGDGNDTCAQSGTRFGSWGPDASRAAWRIAMDYVLHREESHNVVMYDRDGMVDDSIRFGAQRYLNRIVIQYATSSICDGGERGDCMRNTTSPFRLAYSYDLKFNATNVMCDNVPNEPESWWAGFMAYPTFAAFIAPYDEIGAARMTNWMDTFSSICNFSEVNMLDYDLGKDPKGAICITSYFEASQAVISTMIMADTLRPIKTTPVDQFPVTVLKAEVQEDHVGVSPPLPAPRALTLRVSNVLQGFAVAAVAWVLAAAVTRHRRQFSYAKLRETCRAFEKGTPDEDATSSYLTAGPREDA